MDKLMKKLVYDNLNERSEEFEVLLKESDVKKLSTKALWDIEILPVDMKMSLYFILEYKLQLLINKSDNESIAHVNYLISYYLFNILTPVFGRELSIKYAKDAVRFYELQKYKEWLEYVKNENNIY